MIWYHGTSLLALQSIRKEGLKPGASKGGDTWAKRNFDPWESLPTVNEERKHSVYLTKELRIATWFANMAAQLNDSEPVVLEIAIPKSMAGKVMVDESGKRDDPDWASRIEGSIPPDLIKAEIPVPQYDPILGSMAL